MEQGLVINWSVVVPLFISSFSPAITGFIQQLSQNTLARSPWYIKSAVNACVGGLLATVAAYAASGDALISATGGVILGSIGSINIALRKGTRGNLEASIISKG